MSDTTTLQLVPGNGLLVRRGDALLYTPQPDHTLIEAFTTSTVGHELQALASATVAAGFDVAPFVCLRWDGDLRVMAFGDIAVETDQPTLPMLSGAGSRTWVEHTVSLAASAVIEVAGTDADAGTRLVDGTVLAGGFRLELSTASPPTSVEEAAPAFEAPNAADAAHDTLSPPSSDAPAADPTTAVARVSAGDTTPPSAPAAVADPDDPRAALAAIQAAAVGPDGQPLHEHEAAPPMTPATATSSDADAEAHDPDHTLPPLTTDALLADVRAANGGSLVEAKCCSEGHVNAPTSAACTTCGEFMTPESSPIVHVPRPSLGHLVLDDGEVVLLDQELLLGRNPDRDDDPDRATHRRIKTGGDKVSRTHLEVRFQGWDVLVADCGSTNGTFVVPHPGAQVVALDADRPHILEPGAVVYFGSRSFTVHGRDGQATS